MSDSTLQRDIKVIEIQDYLVATAESSKGARWVLITLVVASILIFGALINSLQNQWMLQRLQTFSKSDYIESKIGKPPKKDNARQDKISELAFVHATEEYNKLRQALYEAMAKSYVENDMSIKAPFFGFTIDANDLGILGGLALATVLLMFIFSITREVENLSIARYKAEEVGQIPEFYDVLAMRQILTVPRSFKREEPTKFLRLTPKVICLLPLAVHSAVSVHDLLTSAIGSAISPLHNIILFITEFMIMQWILILTIMAIKNLVELDNLWKVWWDKRCQVEKDRKDRQEAKGEKELGDQPASGPAMA